MSVWHKESRYTFLHRSTHKGSEKAMRRVGILCVNKVNMPARHISKQTRVGKWPNGDVVVAANVPSKAELRRILDYVADPGVAITSPSMQPILFEVQPANIPGKLKTQGDFIKVAPCKFSLANFWEDRKHFGDITVEASNGAQERAHTAMADRLPTFRKTLSSRPDRVAVNEAPTGSILKVFLHFLYTGEYDSNGLKTDEELQQLLQLAEHYTLTTYRPIL